MKPKFFSPAVLHIFALAAITGLSQGAEFNWTGGVDGNGTIMGSSGGYGNWSPALTGPDIATGTANTFIFATRVDGGPTAPIGNGGYLTSGGSPRMGLLKFDDTAGHFPAVLTFASSVPVNSVSRVFHFETPDTTVISLEDSVTTTVKIGTGDSEDGRLGIRLPASGVNTFHVANAAATLDLSGLFDNTNARGGISAGADALSLAHAKIRKTGAGNLDLRTTDGQGNRVLGTIIEGGKVFINTTLQLGWTPTAFMEDHLVIDGGTLSCSNATTITSSQYRGVKIGDNDATFEVTGAGAVAIDGVIQNEAGEVGTLVKTGSGRLILSATDGTNPVPNTYSGGTHVMAGSIGYEAAGDFGTGPVTLEAGTRIGANVGNGIMSSPITAMGNFGVGLGTFISNIDSDIDLNGATRQITLVNSTNFGGDIKNGGVEVISTSATRSFTITGQSSYTGDTTVSGGRLIVNGTVGSAVTVASGASVGGNGEIAANVTVNGHLVPGPVTAGVTGILQINGALALNTGADATFEIIDDGMMDRVVGPTSVSLDGPITVNLLNSYDPPVGTSFDLIDTTGALTLGPNFSLVLPTLPPEKAWVTTSFASSGVISVGEAASQTPFQAWASGYSLAGDDALPSGNPDKDAFTNLQEFAFGTNPTTPDGALVKIEKSGANALVTYIERNTDAVYSVTSSGTLTGWTAAAGITYQVGVDQTGVPTGYTRKQFTSPLGTKDFFRVEAVANP